MNLSPTVLVVDDEKNGREGMVQMLDSMGYLAHGAASGKEALKMVVDDRPDVVITDLRMPEMDGLTLLTELKKKCSGMPIIVLTAFGSVETAVKAMHMGAFHYLVKPVNWDEMKIVLKKALNQLHLEEENKELKETLKERTFPSPIIGRSKKMQEVLKMSEQVAKTSSTILIQGESGTGKELIAHLIHDLSPRKEKPFVALHCAALTETLLASELFGHERGAFTGATERKVGRFERAHGGTLFLDEIGEIPKEMQVKLLRVLQEGEFERVGGTKTIKVDVRLISATNKNLSDEVKKGNFREDLYYRINVILVEMPVLRDRAEDIPLLVDHFIKEFARTNNKKITGIDKPTLETLKSYPWPGNIRELKNVIERMVVLSSQETLQLQDVPQDILKQGGQTSNILPVNLNLKDAEKELILQKLARNNGNKSKAAKELGISRRTLYRKLDEYKI